MRRRDHRLTWAEAKLREARRLALRYFRQPMRIERKADRSPVTVADRAIETFLRRQLERAFPGEPIIGEEFGPPRGHPSTYWTVDPIDGTRAFTRGLPSWGILLGRVEEGRAVLAACEFPVADTFLGVAPGLPAYERCQGRRRRLRRARRAPALRAATVFHGGSSWWLGTKYQTGFSALVRRCFLERAYGDCYAYLWVLRGNADAMLDYGPKCWDLVPFSALAQATGRVMTDFAGRPSFTGPESLLAHPSLVRQIVKILHV